MDGRLLAATIVISAALVVICLLPASAERRDDLGDGMSQVDIPRYVKTPPARPRTWFFMAICAALGLLFLGWTRPSPSAYYADLVRDLATAITGNPAAVNGYVARLLPATGFLAVAYIIGISLVVRASLARRLAMLFHVPLYLAMSVLAEALLISTGIASGWLISPFGIEATLLNLLIGGLVVLRLTFSAFVLPRATIVRRNRPLWIWDDVLSLCAVISVVALLIVCYAYLAEPGNLTSVWQVYIPLYALSILFVAMSAPLWLLWWASRRLPEPGPDRPPLDIIVPAYNEEDNLARLLRSVDVAAGRYGGPVRVVLRAVVDPQPDGDDHDGDAPVEDVVAADEPEQADGQPGEPVAAAVGPGDQGGQGQHRPGEGVDVDRLVPRGDPQGGGEAERPQQPAAGQDAGQQDVGRDQGRPLEQGHGEAEGDEAVGVQQPQPGGEQEVAAGVVGLVVAERPVAGEAALDAVPEPASRRRG